MQISPAEVDLFFKLRRSLLWFANQRLQLLPGEGDTPEAVGLLPPESMFRVGQAILEHRELIQSFEAENPLKLEPEELAIIASWQHAVAGKFYVFLELTKYTVFLSSGSPSTAYGVLALAQPFSELLGTRLPIMVDAVLLPFKDRIVYDGILNRHSITFGGGVRRLLNESFQSAKARVGIVTSLPAGSLPVPVPVRKRSSSKPTPPAEDPTEVLARIIGLTDQFCREHLNSEYAALCRKLAEKLGSKRPSPLLRGKPETWACGIVRTVGWSNFLGDSSQKPHLKLTVIDRAFGIGESTGQGKSKEIRKLLKIRQLDWRWILPSRWDEYSIIWIVDFQGLPMDVRRAPREVQLAAFEKGLIPYVPADRARNDRRY